MRSLFRLLSERILRLKEIAHCFVKSRSQKFYQFISRISGAFAPVRPASKLLAVTGKLQVEGFHTGEGF